MAEPAITSSVGHIVRQVFFAIVLMIFAGTQAVSSARTQMTDISDIGTGFHFLFTGGIVVFAMSPILVAFGFVARRSNSKLVRSRGLILMRVFYVGTLMWVAGMGMVMRNHFRPSMTGHLFGVLLFNTSFFLLCRRDYVPDDDVTQDGTVLIRARRVHLVGLVMYLLLSFGHIAGGLISANPTNVMGWLLQAGVLITVASSTALDVLESKGPSSRTNLGFLYMFLVFAGSILMATSLGLLLSQDWNTLPGERQFQQSGAVLGVLGFPNVFVLYYLPNYGYLV